MSQESRKSSESQAKSSTSMRLVIVGGEGVGTIYEIDEGSNLVGRWDPDNAAFPEIDLEKEDSESKVSRKHAVVVRKGNRVTIEDVGSLNGTFLNRKDRLQNGITYELKAGDEIMIGKTFLKFEVSE